MNSVTVSLRIINTKTETMKLSAVTKDYYLTIEQFDADLETCLIIITEPTLGKPYYTCEYTSPLFTSKKIVHVYITK